MTEQDTQSAIEGLWEPDESRQGSLVVFCGFDGSGKTTQITLLRRALTRNGLSVITTRQPTSWFREIGYVRDYLEHGGNQRQARVLAMLSAADRSMHAESLIRPALRRGEIILSDRYVYSAVALFGSRGVDIGFVTECNKYLPEPDIAFYLQVPDDVLLERLVARNGDSRPFEERSRKQIRQICSYYDSLARHFYVVDGTKSVGEIHREVLRAVYSIIGS